MDISKLENQATSPSVPQEKKNLPPGDLGRKNRCHKESTNAVDLPREARRRSERKEGNRTEGRNGERDGKRGRRMRNGEPWIGKRPPQPGRGARPGAVPAAGRGRPQTAMRYVAAQQPGPPQARRRAASFLPSFLPPLSPSLRPAAAPRAPRSPPGRSAPPPGRPEAAPARGHAAQAALPLLPAPVPHRRPARSRGRREAVALTWRAARRAGVPASPHPALPGAPGFGEAAAAPGAATPRLSRFHTGAKMAGGQAGANDV